MFKLFFTLCFVIAVFNATSQIFTNIVDTSKIGTDFSKFKIVELPRPNSGTYSFEEAGKRKSEIYDLQPTSKYFEWKNPTSGGAVHINKNDEIEVYQFTIGIYQYSNDTAVFISDAPRDTFIVVRNSKDLRHHVGGIGFGNPASVLITSEVNLNHSQAIKKVLEELWTPGVQIYYLTKK